MSKTLWERHQAEIDALQTSTMNFDLERRHEYTRENGWNVDDYEAELPAEASGPALPNGSWAAAQQVLREYTFPPPDLITGIFYPDRPLEQRVMLLRGRFLVFTFYFGVKIGGVLDTTRDGNHGLEQVWGYNYYTLEGHFERGQIEFEIIKRLATGAVLFRIHAFSQTGTIRNPFYNIGFKLFGRRLQKKFARESLKRMQRLVQEQLAAGATPATDARAPVQPMSSDQNARDELENSAD